ncbi:sigma-70 family RNA polymerase sigma factor, partial [Paludisphaera soli]|uniref:sigma-70 family RNA polymerase sigma factor n=1 Tax=Paludisphaera soli TaxID=2712865 RepID=UPI0013EDFCE3
MDRRGNGAFARDLDQLFRRGATFVPDGELLARFLAAGDEGAFESILARHGPMVRGVCGRLLRDPHDADDAFQATFLVLARDGGKLRDRERLASWLYGVARRVCLRARARARSDRRRAEPLAHDVPAREDARAEWSDLGRVVDAELARLPAAQCDVLILCLLGGASEQEASRRLDCPVGTVKSRLSRARDALRGRLVRRGVAPAAALAAASAESFASPASSALIRATLATIAAEGPVPPAVAVLTQGVSSTMFSKALLATLALAGGLGLLGLLSHSAPAWTADPPPEAPAAPPPDADARVKVANLQRILIALQDYPDRFEGRFPAAAILGPDGRPNLSWRVALLPSLGEEELYNEFHLDEPWDSPHNKTLLARMPAVFQIPGDPTPQGWTRFRGFSSPGSMFGPISDSMESGMMGGMGAGMMGSMGPGVMKGMSRGPRPTTKGTGGRMPGVGRAATRSGGTMGMGGAGGLGEALPKREEDPPAVAPNPERLAADPRSSLPDGAGSMGMMGMDSGMMGGMGAGMMGMMPGGPAGALSGGADSPSQGVWIGEITDGTSNTAFLAIAAEAVEWTKPGELAAAYDHAPALEVSDPRGLVVGLVDGSVRFLPPGPRRDQFLWFLITRSGGEVLDWNNYFPRELP